MERYRKYQCATSLVGLKRVKAHFTVSHLLKSFKALKLDDRIIGS